LAIEHSVHPRADGHSYTCTVHRPTDPYEELANCCKYGARGYDQRLKALALFEHLNPDDVWTAWRAIVDATRWGWQDPRGVNGLRQKAANIACGSDINQWVDRVAVSHALAAAADALAQPQQTPK
jgi:hypothetical protein